MASSTSSYVHLYASMIGCTSLSATGLNFCLIWYFPYLSLPDSFEGSYLSLYGLQKFLYGLWTLFSMFLLALVNLRKSFISQLHWVYYYLSITSPCYCCWPQMLQILARFALFVVHLFHLCISVTLGSISICSIFCVVFSFLPVIWSRVS